MRRGFPMSGRTRLVDCAEGKTIQGNSDEAGNHDGMSEIAASRSAREVTAVPAPAAPKEPDPSETRVAAVEQVLDTKLAQYGGTWSAPYIDLERGRDVTVNDEKLVAASLVKLYIMLAVFDDGIEHDTITDDANVDALLKQMITVSSNEAANGLLSRIGNGDGKAAIATVTATAQRYGFTSSEELRTLTGMASGNAVENWADRRATAARSSLRCTPGRWCRKTPANA